MNKISAFFIITVVLVCTEFLLPANKTMYYTALGDSIAEGASATENHGYTYLLEKYYEGIYSNVVYNNHAKSGDTSADLLTKLETSDEVKEAVKSADVITVSVGGNDLLKGLNQLMQGDFLSLNEGLKSFSKNWETINKRIKELNAKAQFYVVDLYNPINIGDYYLGVKFDIEKWGIVENYINELNKIISSEDLLNKYGYKVVKVHSAFAEYTSQGKMLTNFKVNSDPHPNDEGHEVIFKQHLSLIK